MGWVDIFLDTISSNIVPMHFCYLKSSCSIKLPVLSCIFYKWCYYLQINIWWNGYLLSPNCNISHACRNKSSCSPRMEPNTHHFCHPTRATLSIIFDLRVCPKYKTPCHLYFLIIHTFIVGGEMSIHTHPRITHTFIITIK